MSSLCPTPTAHQAEPGQGEDGKGYGNTIPSENLRDRAWNIKQTKKEAAGKVMPIKDKK